MLGPDNGQIKIDQHLNNIDCLSGEDVRCIVAVLLPGDGHVGTEVITPTILHSVDDVDLKAEHSDFFIRTKHHLWPWQFKLLGMISLGTRRFWK